MPPIVQCVRSLRIDHFSPREKQKGTSATENSGRACRPNYSKRFSSYSREGIDQMVIVRPLARRSDPIHTFYFYTISTQIDITLGLD
jgi:hypothetical protein